MRPEEEQSFTGTCAAKKVKLKKMTANQKTEPKIICNGHALKNVFLFKYLGSIFAANGSQEHDLQRRITLAMSRMGQLRHVFNSDVNLGLKMKICKVVIGPLLTYGSEAWDEGTGSN